jgi:hypothetical protein
MTDTKHIEHVLMDTTEDVMTIEEHLPTSMGGIATFYIVRDTSCSSWCPNALQLRALRDRCNAILAQHTAKQVDPGPWKMVQVRSVLSGIALEIESGSDIPSAHEGAVIRIDIQGNEDGPAWVGGLDDLAFLSSAIDDIWDRYCPPSPSGVPLLEEPSSKEVLRTLGDMEALGELVADEAGNLCTLEGKVIATGDPLWLKRVANVVNMVNMLPQIAKLEREGDS